MTPSERFADARSSLLGDAAWDASREDTCRALSLPAQPDAFIEQLASDLDDAYQRTRDGLSPQHAIYDLAARGQLPVERLDALAEPASLTALRARVDSLMPPADLPDLVLEIAAKIRFLQAFTNDHTTLTGRYRVLLPAPLHDRGAYRALNTPQDAAAA